MDARLTWIGTRSIPYDYTIPSLAVDNHMICTVFLGEEKYFLDATEEYVGFGDYAYRIQGNSRVGGDRARVGAEAARRAAQTLEPRGGRG